MARVVASYVAEFYEKPCSPKGFPLRVMPALQLCLRSWKGKQGKPYYFTIVSIPKEISVCRASQTKLQMSTLFPSTPRMVNLCELDNRILPSYFSAQQVGPPFEEKPQHCCPKNIVLCNTWWFKAEFLFRLMFLGWLFFRNILPKREAACKFPIKIGNVLINSPGLSYGALLKRSMNLEDLG